MRVRAKFSFRQRAALKDDPVLNKNVLVGFDTLNDGELRSVRLPMDQISTFCPCCQANNITIEGEDEKVVSMTTLSESTMSALKACLMKK
jgi:hypothetical protein